MPPNSTLPSDFDAFDVFVGYLAFDAVIANRDRHDENWAILRPVSNPDEIRLCGSFDHGRALGSTLREDAMAKILDGNGIANWAARGTAWRFEHRSSQELQTLVELARDALAMVDPKVRTHWLGVVSSLDATLVTEVTDRLPPELSEVPRTFMREVIAMNRRRVLDDC